MRPAVPRPPWKPAAHDDPGHAAAAVRLAPSGGGARKKCAGVRAWLAVDLTGETLVVEAGKPAIMSRTGLPARDLRVLDPLLSYPATVLGRDRAIVVSLEHIKAIITAHEILVLNFADPAVAPFVHDLQNRLLHRRIVQEGGESRTVEMINHASVSEGLKVSSTNSLQTSGDNCSGASVASSEADGKSKGELILSHYNQKDLPFEFIALEACLEATSSCLENEATMLEHEAYPALDRLTSKISTLNLERVRQIKSQLVAITGRVQKVRDELEHLLDDDGDMAEMYLTDKLMHQNLSDGSSESSIYDHGIAVDDSRVCSEISLEGYEIGKILEGAPRNSKCSFELSRRNTTDRDGQFTHTSSTRSSSKHLDVDDLEMLLEAYFIQIDSTLNKLVTLREYVDGTEDYINIMLDDKQNHLLQMGVVLTTATSIISAFIVLVGIFGMNIQNDLYDEEKSGTREFVLTVGGGALGCVILYIVSIAWCKQRRLLE